MKVEIHDISNAEKEIENYKKELYSDVDTKSEIYEKYGLSYFVWDNVPDEIKIDDKDIEKRVWLAGEKADDDTIYLKEYYQAGESNLPDGGLKLHKVGVKHPIYVNYDQVILHPEEIDFTKEQKKRIEEFKEKVEEAKKHKYVNPLTDRKCSYTYALQKGFITETGDQIPLKEMKFENPESGRMVSYAYAKQKGII